MTRQRRPLTPELAKRTTALAEALRRGSWPKILKAFVEFATPLVLGSTRNEDEERTMAAALAAEIIAESRCSGPADDPHQALLFSLSANPAHVAAANEYFDWLGGVEVFERAMTAYHEAHPDDRPGPWPPEAPRPALEPADATVWTDARAMIAERRGRARFHAADLAVEAFAAGEFEAGCRARLVMCAICELERVERHAGEAAH